LTIHKISAQAELDALLYDHADVDISTPSPLRLIIRRAATVRLFSPGFLVAQIAGSRAEAWAAGSVAEAWAAGSVAVAGVDGSAAVARVAGSGAVQYRGHLADERKITLADIRAAAEWAHTAADGPRPLGGTTRAYRQGSWDCGTSCCMWGAAHLRRLNVPALVGPTNEWAAQSKLHWRVAALLRDSEATPADVLALLDAAAAMGEAFKRLYGRDPGAQS